MRSTSDDSSTYKSGSTTPRSSSDIHENENVPSVSSPSRNLMRDEKSEIRSNSPKRESGSKMAGKSHIKNQIQDPCSNTSVRQYKEEAPSQDSMPEGDSNLSSFMSEDNSNERKDDGIAYDKLEKGQNNTRDTRGCTSNNDKPDYSTNYSLPQEQDINAIVEVKTHQSIKSLWFPTLGLEKFHLPTILLSLAGRGSSSIVLLGTDENYT